MLARRRAAVKRREAFVAWKRCIPYHGAAMARPFFRRNIDAMGPYVPGEQPPAGSSVIKLNTNENPYPPSPAVAEAVKASVGYLHLYPDPESTRLREIAGRAWGFPPDWIIAGNGSDELLSILVRAFVGEGEPVAYPVPTYSLYRTLVRAQGAVGREIPWPEDYSLPDGLEGRLVFVSRPNAPTGTVVSLDSLRGLAGRLQGVLCVDEAYVDFADDDAMPLVREFDNVVVLRSLSKSFSLAGARLGLGFARPEMIAGLRKVKDSYNLSRMAQAAGEAALSDIEVMRRNAAMVKASRERLVRRLELMGIPTLPSKANFVLAKIGPEAAAVYEALKRRGILVRYFDEDRLRESLRISVGTDAQIDELLAALHEIRGSLRG